MQIRPLTPLVVLLAMLAMACGGTSSADTTDVVVAGDAVNPLESLRPAPEFELATLGGGTMTSDVLSEHKVVMMNFWASWCGPCRAEMPDIIDLYEEYKDDGFIVLGVTVNDLPRDSRGFAEELDVPYPMPIGTPAMLEDYELSPWLPTTLLIVDGEIVSEWIGPRTRADFEYPIKVALGKAPPLAAVLSGLDGVSPADGE